MGIVGRLGALVMALAWLGAQPAWADAPTPPAPAHAPPPLSVYGQLPGFERAAISASGDHIAIIGMVNGVRRLLILDAAHKLVSASGVGDVKIRSLRWAGDQAVLVGYSQTVGLPMDFTADKAELGSVMVFPLDGGKPWVVFDKIESITGGVQGSYGIVQRGGHWYGYFGGITLVRSQSGDYLLNNTEPDLYEVDLHSRAARLVAHKAETNNDNDIDRDWAVNDTGAVVATFELVRKTGEWSIRNAHNQKIAGGVDPLAKVGMDGLGPDGTSVIYVVRSAGQDNWFRMPLAGGAAQPFLADQAFTGLFTDRTERVIG